MKTHQVRLREIAEIITGIAEDKSVEGAFRYSCYQANSFSESGEISELPIITRKEVVSERQLVKEGDVLLKRLNPNFPLLVVEPPEDSVVSSNLFILRAGGGILPSYLAFLFEQPNILAQVTQISGANSAIKAISAKKLKDITLPILPLDIQALTGKYWGSGKRRKKLLLEYISENDRLMATVADSILR
jgi:restriction endonuclease S subunit